MGLFRTICLEMKAEVKLVDESQNRKLVGAETYVRVLLFILDVPHNFDQPGALFKPVGLLHCSGCFPALTNDWMKAML